MYRQERQILSANDKLASNTFPWSFRRYYDFKATTAQDTSDAEKAWARLIELIDKRIRPQFASTTTAPEILTLAEKNYGAKDPARYIKVTNQLRKTRYTGNDVGAHIEYVKTLVDTMKLHTNDVITVTQELLFLADTLPFNFHEIKTHLIAGTIKSWEQATSLLLASEIVRNDENQPEPESEASSRVALAVKNTDRSKVSLTFEERRNLVAKLVEENHPACTICLALGHYAEGHVSKTKKPRTTSTSSSPGAGKNVAAASVVQTKHLTPSSATNCVDQLAQVFDASLCL